MNTRCSIDYRSALDKQLAAQNILAPWRDCTYAGLRHRPNAETRIGDAVYTRCARCPTTVRTTTKGAA